jgi:hypothetical protein
MFPGKMRRWGEGDEPLRAVGVRASVSHYEQSTDVS